LKILILGAAELQIALPFGQRPLVRQNGQPFHSSEAQEPSSLSEAHRRDTNKIPLTLAILDSYCYLWLRRKYFHSEIKRKASFPFVFHSFIRIFAER
jgi:hypothetical protein